jgi:hypothetical protein
MFHCCTLLAIVCIWFTWLVTLLNNSLGIGVVPLDLMNAQIALFSVPDSLDNQLAILVLTDVLANAAQIVAQIIMLPILPLTVLLSNGHTCEPTDHHTIIHGLLPPKNCSNSLATSADSFLAIACDAQ